MPADPPATRHANPAGQTAVSVEPLVTGLPALCKSLTEPGERRLVDEHSNLAKPPTRRGDSVDAIDPREVEHTSPLSSDLNVHFRRTRGKLVPCGPANGPSTLRRFGSGSD
jgi:hypothetical protein